MRVCVLGNPDGQRSLGNNQDPVAFLPQSEPSGLENPKNKGSALQNRSTVFVSVFCYCVGLCLFVILLLMCLNLVQDLLAL